MYSIQFSICLLCQFVSIEQSKGQTAMAHRAVHSPMSYRSFTQGCLHGSRLPYQRTSSPIIFHKSHGVFTNKYLILSPSPLLISIYDFVSIALPFISPFIFICVYPPLPSFRISCFIALTMLSIINTWSSLLIFCSFSFTSLFLWHWRFISSFIFIWFCHSLPSLPPSPTSSLFALHLSFIGWLFSPCLRFGSWIP